MYLRCSRISLPLLCGIGVEKTQNSPQYSLQILVVICFHGERSGGLDLSWIVVPKELNRSTSEQLSVHPMDAESPILSAKKKALIPNSTRSEKDVRRSFTSES